MKWIKSDEISIEELKTLYEFTGRFEEWHHGKMHRVRYFTCHFTHDLKIHVRRFPGYEDCDIVHGGDVFILTHIMEIKEPNEFNIEKRHTTPSKLKRVRDLREEQP